MRPRAGGTGRPSARPAGTAARAVDGLNTVVAWVCHGLLIVITTVTVMQVFLRFVVNRPTSWSEEIALLCLIWFGFLALAVGIRRHQHLAVTTLRDRLSPRGAHALDVAAQALVAVFMGTVFWNARALVELTGAQILPASQLSKAWLYLPAAVGSGLGCLNAAANLALRDVAPPKDDDGAATDTATQPHAS